MYADERISLKYVYTIIISSRLNKIQMEYKGKVVYLSSTALDLSPASAEDFLLHSPHCVSPGCCYTHILRFYVNKEFMTLEFVLLLLKLGTVTL